MNDPSKSAQRREKVNYSSKPRKSWSRRQYTVHKSKIEVCRKDVSEDIIS